MSKHPLFGSLISTSVVLLALSQPSWLKVKTLMRMALRIHSKA